MNTLTLDNKVFIDGTGWRWWDTIKSNAIAYASGRYIDTKVNLFSISLDILVNIGPVIHLDGAVYLNNVNMVKDMSLDDPTLTFHFTAGPSEIWTFKVYASEPYRLYHVARPAS